MKFEIVRVRYFRDFFNNKIYWKTNHCSRRTQSSKTEKKNKDVIYTRNTSKEHLYTLTSNTKSPSNIKHLKGRTGKNKDHPIEPQYIESVVLEIGTPSNTLNQHSFELALHPQSAGEDTITSPISWILNLTLDLEAKVIDPQKPINISQRQTTMKMLWRKQNLIKGAVAKVRASLVKILPSSSKHFFFANKKLWWGSGAQSKVRKTFELKNT